jgi:integrase
MEIKQKLFKRKSGKSAGQWCVRINYFDDVTEKEHTVERLFPTRSKAVSRRDQLIAEIRKTDGQITTGDKMTFSNLAAICDQRFYQKAIIVEGRKIAGVRSFNTAQTYLKTLRSYFGKKTLKSISTESLSQFRIARTESVKIATVNRELSALRRMLRYAHAQGWVTRDIFYKSEVIDSSAEMERTRILSLDEEKRLLEACESQRSITYSRMRNGKNETVNATTSVYSPFLKALIILAVDSGLRRGEILKLRWKDFDFDRSVINIIGTHTKTERPRQVPFSQRAKDELTRLLREHGGVDERPFPISEFKRSWNTAKKIAGITDLRFHDLRRTAISRWITDGHPLAMAGKIAGHTSLQTTQKYYTAASAEIIQSFTNSIDSRNTDAVYVDRGGDV